MGQEWSATAPDAKPKPPHGKLQSRSFPLVTAVSSAPTAPIPQTFEITPVFFSRSPSRTVSSFRIRSPGNDLITKQGWKVSLGSYGPSYGCRGPTGPTIHQIPGGDS